MLGLRDARAPTRRGAARTRSAPSRSVPLRRRRPSGCAPGRTGRRPPRRAAVCRPSTAAVEQRRLVEVVERLGERDVVDVRSMPDARCRRGRLGRPGSRSASRPRRPCGRRTPRCRPARRRPTGRPRPGRGCGGAPARAAPSRAPRRPAGRRSRRRARRRRRRRAGRLGVEQHPRLALLPQLHRLGAVRAGVAEPERGEGARDRGLALVVDRELGEREAVQPRRGRQAPPADLDAGAAGGPGPGRRTASASASSERRASTAARRGSAWRNTSLNTSSDSGPA